MITPRIKPASRTTGSIQPTRPARRSRRSAYPRVETLEGRALLATAAFDPTFGQGGFVTGLLSDGADFNADNATALAVDIPLTDDVTTPATVRKKTTILSEAWSARTGCSAPSGPWSGQP